MTDSIFLNRQITRLTFLLLLYKIEEILKGSLDSISSPLPSVKIQIISGRVSWSDKTLLADVKKLSNIFPLHLKHTFPPIIWIKVKMKVRPSEGDDPAYL